MGNVTGLKELSDQLSRLERATAIKAMRSAAMGATLPTTKEMRAAAPRGRNVHRTYKGRLVAPGFLSRSVIRKTRVNKKTGTVSVAIGVKREAFYGIAFLDRGVTVTQRRMSVKGKKSLRKISVNYRIKGTNWFANRFKKNSGNIVQLFKVKLAARIAKGKQ